jgi:amino acid transporter
MRSWLKGALISLVIFVIYVFLLFGPWGIYGDKELKYLVPYAIITQLIPILIVGASCGGIYGYLKRRSGDTKFRLDYFFASISLFFLAAALLITALAYSANLFVFIPRELGVYALLILPAIVIGVIFGTLWLFSLPFVKGPKSKKDKNRKIVTRNGITLIQEKLE